MKTNCVHWLSSFVAAFRSSSHQTVITARSIRSILNKLIITLRAGISCTYYLFRAKEPGITNGV